MHPNDKFLVVVTGLALTGIVVLILVTELISALPK